MGRFSSAFDEAFCNRETLRISGASTVDQSSMVLMEFVWAEGGETVVVVGEWDGFLTGAELKREENGLFSTVSCEFERRYPSAVFPCHLTENDVGFAEEGKLN